MTCSLPSGWSRISRLENINEKLKNSLKSLQVSIIVPIYAGEYYRRRLHMSYSQMAQLELLNALNNINSEAELNEFKDLVARYFAQKAQKAIDALWNEGAINEKTIEEWGDEHMRTPYKYEANRS